MASKPGSTPSSNPFKLLQELESREDTKRQQVTGRELDPHMALLRKWQADRLAQTYADFLADKRYRPGCLFIVNDIYAPRDYSQRDYDLEHAYNILSRFFPDYMLELLLDTMKLNKMTKALDQALLVALVDQLGVIDTISPQLYAEGYRICDNYVERAHQIDLIAKIIRQVDKGARLFLVDPVLRLTRAPAQRTGWGDVHDVLERGYAALKHMRGAEQLIQAIDQREKRILHQIFSCHPNPFEIS